MTERKQHLQLESLNRISKIPVVETGVHVATGLYGRIKNSNSLVRWGLDTVEGGVNKALDKSLTTFPLLELPLTMVDTIVCRGLDTVQQHVPAINYPPEKILNQTKSYVSTNIVEPVLKRADSVKQFSLQEANKYSELAATRIDTALDVADQYVDKYLPADATDGSDAKQPEEKGDNKKLQTIAHVNRLSRKLQRRLTKRTIAEARALRKQGADAAQILLKLAQLLVKDPKQFVAKMKALWEHLSQDEPENQLPPANVEQLIGMLTRESARRIVHLTNFAVVQSSRIPQYTSRACSALLHQTNYYIDLLLKTVHLEGAKADAVNRAQGYINHLYSTYRELEQLTEKFLGLILSNINRAVKKPVEGSEQKIPLHILSPVAQSPERSTPAENPPSERKQENQAAKPTTPVKKQRKNKSASSENGNQQVKANDGDENYNRQPVLNGDAPKTIQ